MSDNQDGYDPEWNGPEDEDGEFEFDCGMYPDGQCGKAGSEECDFECPVMADIHRRNYAARHRKRRA